MRPIAFVYTPPSIAIAIEPLGDAAGSALDPHDGLQLVPSGQARPVRRTRGRWAALPMAAVVAASALALVGERDAARVRESARGGTTPSRSASPAIIVAASRTSASEAARSSR